VILISIHLTKTDWSVGPAFLGQAGTNIPIFSDGQLTQLSGVSTVLVNFTDETIQEGKKTDLKFARH
jgi:hypothetical protein